MTKRPDQYQIDQNEAGATDYKFRRQTQDGNRHEAPDAPDDLESGRRGTTQTPNQALEARRRQSENDREKELERAAGVRDRGEKGDQAGETAEAAEAGKAGKAGTESENNE